MTTGAELTRVPLGQSGITLTELGFGGSCLGNLGQAVDDDTARAAVDAAWDAGIRYFDTAPHYGLGLAETRLGDALRDRPRDEFVLSTKVGRLLVDTPPPWGSDLADGGFDVPARYRRVRDFSADGVRRSLEDSLLRLGLDRVDVVLVHDPDDAVDDALAGAVPALLRWRDEGVIGAVGVGMNHVAPLQRFVAEADVDVVMVAGRWTLVDRTALPLLDRCHARGVGVIAAAPFNSGLLARPWPPDDAWFDYGPAGPERLAQARELARRLEAEGTTLPQAALVFPLAHPAVSSVLAGLRTPEQVAAAVAWLGGPRPVAV